MRINPFFELYVGYKLSSREFVDIFSPFLVDHARGVAALPGVAICMPGQYSFLVKSS